MANPDPLYWRLAESLVLGLVVKSPNQIREELTETGTKSMGTEDQDTTKRERGLYGKFRIERTDGRSAPGEKHEDCRYFVLDLDHDPHAIPALRAYTESARHDGYGPLADDLETLAGGSHEDTTIQTARVEPCPHDEDLEPFEADYHAYHCVLSDDGETWWHVIEVPSDE